MQYRSFLEKFHDESAMFAERNANYLETVCQDVEALLNTRQPSIIKQLAGLGLDDTVLAYGLSDLSQYDPYSTHDQMRISRAIALALHHFEPRLREVQVKVLTSQKTEAGRLIIHIEAILTLPDGREPVLFISEFNRLEGNFTIGKYHG